MNAYVFFSRFDPSQLPEDIVDDFRMNVERNIARTMRIGGLHVLTGTCRSSGGGDVYVRIFDDSAEPVNQLRLSRLREQLMPDINMMYSAAKMSAPCKPANVFIEVTNSDPKKNADKAEEAEKPVRGGGEFDYAARAKTYVADKPRFGFDRVILPESTRRRINDAMAIVRCADVVFGKWGLNDTTERSVALNFCGAPGTGKTMAAEAFAAELGMPIIRAGYADIESKYHGEGPKMIKALFLAAEQQHAVLFIDEADSLLSRRLEHVTQGSEQAINSMRSQLLLSLEEQSGVVIFATNLMENYDRAFLSRLTCVTFDLPDEAARGEIWRVHLFASDSAPNLDIPLAENVSIAQLAADYEFSGRDIREAVKTACIRTVSGGGSEVTQETLVAACEDIVISRKPQNE